MALNLGPLNVMLRLQGAQRFTRDARSASGSIDKLAGAAKGLAAAYVSVSTAQKALQLASNAAAFEDASRIFRLAGGNLDELRKSVNGTVSDFELVKKANLARIMGIPSDAMGTLAQAAIAASKATGESVDFMLDSIVRGVARGSPLILDNLGIIISIEEASATYAKTLGKNADALTKAEKAQAVLNATLKAVGPQIEAANKANANSAEIYRQTEAQVQNLSIQLGQSLMPALAAILPLAIDVAKYLGFIFTGTTPEFQAEEAATKMADEAAKLSSQLKKAEEQARQLQRALTEGYGEELARQWDPTLTALEAALKLQKQIIGLRAKLKKMVTPPAVAPLGGQTTTTGGGGGRLAADEGIKAVKELFEDMPVLVSEVEMSWEEFNKLFDTGYIVFENYQDEVDKAAEAQAKLSQSMMDASYAASSLVQAFSQGRGFEEVGSMLGSGAGNMLAAALSGPLGAAIGGALATFAPLPPGVSQAIGAAVGGAIGTGVGVGGGMIGSLVDQFISEMMPILKLPEQVAQAGLNFLSEVVRNTAAISDGQMILEAAYNTLVEAVDPVVRAFLPLAVVIHDVAAPIAQTFGVLLHNLGLFSGVAKLLFGAFKSLGIAALTVADFLATGNAEEQARLRDAREELLDLTYSEAEARAAAILASTDATEAVREFSEELRNVPIGVKRIRGLQFAATSGRFNSPAWGA